MSEHALYVSPSGSDQSDGSASTPFASLSQAARAAKPGTVIHLSAGVYAPAEIKGLAGTAEQPIVIAGAAVPPIDFTPVEQLDNSVYVMAVRQALDDGRFGLASSDGLAVIDGAGAEIGLLLTECQHVRLENLVMRDSRMNLVIRGCRNLVVSHCVVHGDPSRSIFGASLHLLDPDHPHSQFVQFDHVLAYGMKENGFGVAAGSAYDVQWNCCIAHSMQSSGGDGFSFSHVVPVANQPARSLRQFPNGIDYRMRLTRCVALRNRLDGFDIGHGVGGITMEHCLGDGNGIAAYYSKDLKVWSSGNTFRRCRMTGRILFVGGSNYMQDLKTGVKEDGPTGEDV